MKTLNFKNKNKHLIKTVLATYYWTLAWFNDISTKTLNEVVSTQPQPYNNINNQKQKTLNCINKHWKEVDVFNIETASLWISYLQNQFNWVILLFALVLAICMCFFKLTSCAELSQLSLFHFGFINDSWLVRFSHVLESS